MAPSLTSTATIVEAVALPVNMPWIYPVPGGAPDAPGFEKKEPFSQTALS
jgi:hypothetical protein